MSDEHYEQEEDPMESVLSGIVRQIEDVDTQIAELLAQKDRLLRQRHEIEIEIELRERQK